MKKKLFNKRKEFGENLVYSILGIFLLYILLFLWLHKIHPDLPHITLSVHILSFIATAYASYLFSKAQIDFGTRFTIVGLSFFCLLFYLSLLLCQISCTTYYFYIPLILLTLCISDFKRTFIVALFLVILSFCTKSISLFLNIATRIKFSKSNIKVLGIVDGFNILVVAYLSFFLLYYYVQFRKTELLSGKESEVKQKNVVPEIKNEVPISTETDAGKSSADLEKNGLSALYKRIIQYFEEEKPYQSPDFNIKKLADLMETNTTYVSRAMNIYGAKNFSTLVNEYRVAQVKEGLLQNLHVKFTIEYVSSKAGFKKQPTFNRVFKEHTGYTPSEYIKKHQL